MIQWKSKADIDAEKALQEQERIAREEKQAAIESAPEKVVQLQDENMMIMIAAAESYEQMYNENMNLMLAIAELYEMQMEV